MAPRKQQKPAVGKEHVKLSLSSEAAQRLKIVAKDGATMSSVVEELIMADKKKDAAFATSLGQLRAQLERALEDQITAFGVDHEQTPEGHDGKGGPDRLTSKSRDSLMKENEHKRGRVYHAHTAGRLRERFLAGEKHRPELAAALHCASAYPEV